MECDVCRVIGIVTINFCNICDLLINAVSISHYIEWNVMVASSNKLEMIWKEAAVT
jgi:hypothetical protein